MYIQQLYTGCLSEAAYFIESEGEAAVIDPLRDIDSYIQLAKDSKATIKFIFETHFHVYVAKDHEIFTVGKLTIEVLHTPGHTLESACYLLRDELGVPYCIF